MPNLPSSVPHRPGNPIVEAVLDIDCDLPPNFDLTPLEIRAAQAFSSTYPITRKQIAQEVQLTANPESAPTQSVTIGLRSLLHLYPDEKQIIQVRKVGYSFNRLAGYTSLDDYIPEIKRTWDTYREIVAPVLIRKITLRYINRLSLPVETVSQRVELDDYLLCGPKLPDEEGLLFTGFLHRHSISELSTGNQASIVLTTQPHPPGTPFTQVNVILDITTSRVIDLDVSAWERILEVIVSLRHLKNRLFHRSISDRCRALFPPLP